MSKKVYVGLSGGVDSSLSAKLLIDQGYDVTGVYMKNWSQDIGGFACPWKEDYQDAKRLAVQLGIPFEMFDFEKDYFEKVVGYMLDAFKAGITPNPDVMCNQEIKFKLFLDASLAAGADMIATGHYARTGDGQMANYQTDLKMAVDENKDQTYFLYRVSAQALSKTLFPIGHLTKSEVRRLAAQYGLTTATKKESMGICFVGKVGIKDFLKNYVQTTVGPIIDQNGIVLGEHDGAIFYTIGQRHGLDVGGGLPYYVVGKNMATNEVYVTNDLADERLWASELKLTSLHWINEAPKDGAELTVRTRHRAPLVSVESLQLHGENATVVLAEKLRAITPGQSAVLYEGEVCLGGGIIY